MSESPQKTKSGAQKIAVRVSDIVPLNELVTRFEFERVDEKDFPPFSPGSHTVVELKGKDRTRLNPYSLMSDPFDTRRYAISVRRDDEGRGGSLFMHKELNVGDEINITFPVNLFSLDLRAHKNILIAGGIGITPFLPMIRYLERLGAPWELHYSCRNAQLGSYGDELREGYGEKVKLYFDDQKQFIALEKLLSDQPLGTHVYVCGPKGMIDWVHKTADHKGWPKDTVHSEEFLAPQPGKPFEVRLCQSDKTIQVGENESLLEALEREGVDAPYLCRGGACGQCETDVTEFDGEFVHRDHWLDEAQRDSGKKIMPCVSRFVGQRLVLDR